MKLMNSLQDEVDIASYVMSNPNSFPEVFETMMLSVSGLDWPFMARCRQVSMEWSKAIDDMVRRNYEVLRDKIDEGWETKPLKLTKCSHSSSSSRDVRCFVGDEANFVFGLYSGAIEVVFRKSQGRQTLRKGHDGSIFSLAMNEDVLVSGSFDHTVCFWDRKGHKGWPLVARIENKHQDMVYGVSVNKSSQIISVSHDSSVHMWQYFPTLKVVKHITAVQGHQASVKAVDCDGDIAVTASKDMTIKVWTFADILPIGFVANPVAHWPTLTIDIGGSPSCVKLNNPLVVVGVKVGSPIDYNYLIKVFNVETGHHIKTFHGHLCGRITALQIFRQTNRLVSGDEFGNVLLWMNDKEGTPRIIMAGQSRIAGIILSYWRGSIRIFNQRGTGNKAVLF